MIIQVSPDSPFVRAYVEYIDDEESNADLGPLEAKVRPWNFVACVVCTYPNTCARVVCVYICIYIYMHVCIYIYIYI